MTKRLTQKQIKHISDLYYDYEIYELLKYVDELCEYNFKQGMIFSIKGSDDSVGASVGMNL